MAEIHVQTKKPHTTPAWIWILIGLIIAAVVVYLVTTRNKNQNNTQNQNTTSGVELPQQFTGVTYVMSAAA